MFVVFGTRGDARAVDGRAGHRCQDAVPRGGRAARATRTASAASFCRREPRRDAQAGDRRARSRCRARRLRSCLPPVIVGCIRVPRLIHSAPAPFGPLNLCAESDSRSTPSARTSTGIFADRLHRVGVQQRAVLVRDGGELGDRLNRADLVVRVHHRHERGVGRRSPSRSRSGETMPVCVDRQQRRPPAAARRAPCSVFSTASCSMLLATRCRRPVGFERLGRAADREVVRLRCRRS